MRFLRFAAAGFITLLVASGASASTRAQDSSTKLGAPQDLHGFLLRADEPSADTFARTPSFAWKPVRGAQRYQFELATARTFASGAVLWSSKTLTAPATSLPIALPWITGTPYSVYAHVRGVAPDGTTGPWSSPFGFNMRWSNLPTPLSSPAGMIRWSTVDGSSSYQIWYLEPNKIFATRSNVADEREYYTFHNNPSVVHWRIRAVRDLYGIDQSGHEKNGLPTVSYGPWSPVYTSTNPAPSSGALQTVETISDTISSPALPAAHQLMPAFVYSGNTSLGGMTDSLYRVYVATDRDCVNIVFRGAIVGGPAYAPRMTGPLALPTDATDAVPSNRFLPDGSQNGTFTADHFVYVPNEGLAGDTADITSGEDDSPSTDTGAPTTGGGGTSATTTSAAAPSAAPGVATLSTAGVLVGPPIDLWDTDWPTGRYFWTVVPVGMYVKAPLTTVLTNSPAAGATLINVAALSELAIGDLLTIGTGPSAESVTVIDLARSTVTVAPALRNAHGAGETVARIGGSIEYRDEELPQDACAAGRIATFGKTSEPALTASSNLAPFASGLTPSGALASARGPKPSFYGAPLVSWQPALGASAYEVQWSASHYPFKMAATPILTYGTSAVLPLTPRTWWYRVRGIDLSLPAGARAMAWSAPVALVVAKPKFTVVGGKR